MNKKNTLLFLIISLMMITIFLLGGFVLIRFLSVDTETVFWGPYYRSLDNQVLHNASAEYSEAAPKLLITEVLMGYDEETSAVTGVLLLELNNSAGSLSITSIPSITQYTMSSSLYNRLTVSNVTLPQSIRFSELLHYYSDKDKDKAFEHGAAMVSEISGLTADYYTAVPSDIFSALFTFADDLTPGLAASPEDLKYKYKNSTGSLSTYMKELYPLITTNWKLSDRLRYIDTYDKLSADSISLRLIPGEKMNAGYFLK